jgi:hypothetical protein
MTCPGSDSQPAYRDITWPTCDSATCEECGQTIEVEWDVDGPTLPEHDWNREGNPAFNGAFDRW